MALFCKENHCGSCEKAFCCFSCRCKHENNVHTKNPPGITIRKPLAPIKNSPFRTENSLPKILENTELKKIEGDRRKNSIIIYNDSSLSQLGSELRIDDKDEISKEEEEIRATEKAKILTDEKNTLRNVAVPKRALDITVNVPDKLSKPDQDKNLKDPEILENIENIPPNQHSGATVNAATAGKTPPRSFLKAKNSLSLKENSSVYCACSENFTKSDYPSKWISASSEICSSPTENSSIYYACSEFLTRELSPKQSSQRSENFEGFDTFRKDFKLASTKLEMTISFAQEAFETKSDDGIECISSTGVEYISYNLKKDPEIQGASDVGSIQNDKSSESTLSVPEVDSFSLILDERSSMSIEEPHTSTEPRRQYMSDWVRACATQTSLESSLNSLKDSKEEEEETETPTDGNMSSLPPIDPTFSMGREHTFWNSFSHSLQRAYNSTKEMCSNLGRRNKLKRQRDDTEEPQAKRPKTSILCRPPIREAIKVIFRQDGDFRRPVIGFDKGTQTIN